MNEKQILVSKKLFGRINHDQLLNEYVLHNFFCFLSNIIRAIKNNVTNWEEEKMHLLFGSLRYVVSCSMWTHL